MIHLKAALWSEQKAPSHQQASPPEPPALAAGNGLSVWGFACPVPSGRGHPAAGSPTPGLSLNAACGSLPSSLPRARFTVWMEHTSLSHPLTGHVGFWSPSGLWWAMNTRDKVPCRHVFACLSCAPGRVPTPRELPERVPERPCSATPVTLTRGRWHFLFLRNPWEAKRPLP